MEPNLAENNVHKEVYFTSSLSKSRSSTLKHFLILLKKILGTNGKKCNSCKWKQTFDTSDWQNIIHRQCLFTVGHHKTFYFLSVLALVHRESKPCWCRFFFITWKKCTNTRCVARYNNFKMFPHEFSSQSEACWDRLSLPHTHRNGTNKGRWNGLTGPNQPEIPLDVRINKKGLVL